MTLRKPNVVILYADDLGYGDLGCYGGEDIKTPNVDALAKNGLRFSDAYATSPVCTPSRYSLMTGRYPSRREGVEILPGDATCIIDPGVYTLPQLFRDNGYRTSIVGKWHLGLGDGSAPIDWNKPVDRTPLDLGFDECFIFPATADRVPCVYFDGRNVVNLDPNDPITVSYEAENPFPEVPTGREHPELLKMRHSMGHDMTIVNGVGRIGYMRGGKAALWKDEDLAEEFLSHAKSFVTENKDRPFFLYYALHQPHVPRLPSARFAGTTSLGPRGDVIAEMDWCVGEFMNCLKENGLEDNTIVIFSSDNGPVLDDGYQDRAMELNREHRPTGPLRGNKYSRYEGGIRIPFILSYPGTVTPGTTSALVSQVDLLNSFASMLGAPQVDSDSQNMFDALLGKDGFGRSEVYAEGTFQGKVLRQGKWLYIEPDGGRYLYYHENVETGNSLDPQLYNLDYDVGQRKNLAYRYPEKVAAMQKRIDEIKENHAQPLPGKASRLPRDFKPSLGEEAFADISPAGASYSTPGGMAMESQPQLPHKLTLNERRQLTMTGVTEVVSFDEAAVVLHTSLGTLLIQGRDLKLKTLSLDGGQVAVDGIVTALSYEEPRSRGGWANRLFK